MKAPAEGITTGEVAAAPGNRATAPPVQTTVSLPALALGLQRAVGNRGTTRALARQGHGPEQANPAPPGSESGWQSGLVTSNQRVNRIRTLLGGSPDASDLREIERLWTLLTADYQVREAELYRQCHRAGARLPRFLVEDEFSIRFLIPDGAISQQQISRMRPAAERLSIDEYLDFRAVLEARSADFGALHAAFLWKALAARRPMNLILLFARVISGHSDTWLMKNLTVTDELTAIGQYGTGIAQQWQMSCGPTTVQTIRGETDPIYAWRIHQGGSISAQNQGNTDLTMEQGDILQAHGSTPTPIGTAGGGAWVEADLSALSAQTGLSYSFVRVNAVAAGNPADGAVAQAWTAITGFLDQGMFVPLLIGQHPGGNDHYVTALRRAGDNILVNDPGLGRTAWVSRSQVMANTLNPPLSWPYLQGYDRPTQV